MNTSALLVIERSPAEKTNKPYDWMALAPAVAAGVVVIIGWLVVERFARRREWRADLRASVSDFAKAVDEVVTSAVSFYQLPGNDTHAQSLAVSIRIKVGALSSQILLLKDAGLDFDTDELLKRFRQSVTGGSFDELARQALPKDSASFVRLTADGQSLAREVQQASMRHLLRSRSQKRGMYLRRSLTSARPATPVR